VLGISKCLNFCNPFITRTRSTAFDSHTQCTPNLFTVSLLKSRWACRRIGRDCGKNARQSGCEVSTGNVDLKSFSLPARGSSHPRLVLPAGWRAWQLRIFSHDDARRESFCYLSSRTLTFGSCLPVATEMPPRFVRLFLLVAFCFWIVVAHRPPRKSVAVKARRGSDRAVPAPAAAADHGAGAGADHALDDSQTPCKCCMHLRLFRKHLLSRDPQCSTSPGATRSSRATGLSHRRRTRG